MGPQRRRRSTWPATSPTPAASCCATTSTPTWPRASASRGPPPTSDPRDRDVRDFPHGGAVPHHRRRLLRRHQSRPQEAVRDPAGDGGRHRPGPPPARALVRHARRRDRRGLGRPSRRLPGLPARLRVQAPPAPGLGSRLRARTSGRRHPLPPLRPRRWRGRSTPPAATGRWWCSPTSRVSTARPSPCAAGSSSTAPRSAARS